MLCIMRTLSLQQSSIQGNYHLRLSFYPHIGNIYKIPNVIRIISHLVDLRMVILCPVGQYLLFVLVFECSIPDLLDESSKLLALLSGWHTTIMD